MRWHRGALEHMLAADSIRRSPSRVTIGLVFLVERLVTVWAMGWWARALAAAVVIELAYAFFLQAGWNYVSRLAVEAALVASGIVPPSSLLLTDWYRSLSIWVAFNTLVFVVRSLLQLVPPSAVTLGGPGPVGATPDRRQRVGDDHPMHATGHLGYEGHCWSWPRERPTRPAGICRRSSRESGDRFDSGLGRQPGLRLTRRG